MQRLSQSLPRDASLAGLALATLGACGGEGEADMRARLERWFALGDTLAYEAQRACAVAVFELVDVSIASDMPVAGSLPEMLINLRRLGHAAVRTPDQAPDMVMVDAANMQRFTGMQMRRAGLEAKACMDEKTERAFRRVLTSKQAVLAFDQDRGELMIMDADSGLLVVTRGER